MGCPTQHQGTELVQPFPRLEHFRDAPNLISVKMCLLYLQEFVCQHKIFVHARGWNINLRPSNFQIQCLGTWSSLHNLDNCSEPRSASCVDATEEFVIKRWFGLCQECGWLAKHIFREGNRTVFPHEHIAQPIPDIVGDNMQLALMRLARLRELVLNNREVVDSLPLFNQQFIPAPQGSLDNGTNLPEFGFWIDVSRSDGGGVEWIFDEQGCAELFPALSQAQVQHPVERDARSVRDWWAAQMNRNIRETQD